MIVRDVVTFGLFGIIVVLLVFELNKKTRNLSWVIFKYWPQIQRRHGIDGNRFNGKHAFDGDRRDIDQFPSLDFKQEYHRQNLSLGRTLLDFNF